jgi:flagellar assembly factor FliW
MRHDPLAVTANLLGPLVINSRSKLGCQLVLENAEYSVRHLVYSETPEEGGEEDAA